MPLLVSSMGSGFLFPKLPATVINSGKECAFMLRLQIVKPVLNLHIFYKSFEAIDTIFPLLLASSGNFSPGFFYQLSS